MKTTMKIAVLATTLMLATSCYTTKTNIGKYAEANGEVYVYAKAKQVSILWGLIPLGKTKVAVPPSGDCQIITRFSFFDGLIIGLTSGLVGVETIKVKAKRTTQTPTN